MRGLAANSLSLVIRGGRSLVSATIPLLEAGPVSVTVPSDPRLGEHNPHDDKTIPGQHDGRSVKRHVGGAFSV